MKTIIILLLAFTATAQTSPSSLQQQVEKVIFNEQKTLVKSEQVNDMADYLVRFMRHEELFNDAFDSYNCSWCYAVDVYLYDQEEEILQGIRVNEELNFRLPEVSKVAVAVRKEGQIFLVLIASYDY